MGRSCEIITFLMARMMTKNLNAPAQFGNGYISKAEMAQRLSRTGRTVEKWMRAGRLPFLKIGRSVLFHWPTVEKHLNERYQVLRREVRAMTTQRTLRRVRAVESDALKQPRSN